jgi:ATP-dependent Lhr-like helicase
MLPFWRGDVVSRPYELGCAIGQFLRVVDDWSDDRLRDECGLDQVATANLRAYLAQEREATGGVLPTDRTVVVERFQDELGDWRVCLLSPFGAAVHAPWALAVEEVLRRRHRLEVQALWSDDGIVFRLPEVDDPPGADVVVLDPAEVSELVVEALATSSLFAGRFRENAARSLLLPRRRPGQRTPMWVQHQRAADLQLVASRYGEFPILLETYRECLQDVFDLPALQEVLAGIATGEIEVAAVDALTPSPFAGALVWSYVHHFVFESDAPVAERRAQALTLDRRMLAELLGSDDLRDLLDPGVLARVEAELQGRHDSRRAHTPEAAHDLLRRVGDLTAEELAARSDAAAPGAVAIEVAGDTRLIAPEDAGRYRDGLGVQLPAGLPAAFVEGVPDALEQLVARYARTHGPFRTVEVADRFDVADAAVADVLTAMAAAGRVVRGGFRPEGTESEWCDAGVLRTLRQRSLAAYRKEVEPTDPDALARFLPAWHGIGVTQRTHGLDRLRDIVAQLEGVAIPASVLERDVLPARMDDYTPRLLDDLGAAGEVVWLGAGAVGRADGKVVLFRRGSELIELLAARRAGDDGRPAGDEHERIRGELAERGAAFFPDFRGADDRETLEALWDLVWAGEVTNDSLAALRALGSVPKRRAPTTSRGRHRLGTMTAAGPPAAQGRWSLTLEWLGAGNRPLTTPESRATTLAGVLLDRHGVLTREAVRAEGVPGGFAAVYPVLRAMEESGRVRRGYFVAGLGGAQFAVPGAVDRLRQSPASSAPVVLAATDPANPYGAALPWPAAAGGRAQRVAGAYVVLLDGVATLYVERGGRGLLPLRPVDGMWEAEAIAALDALLGVGRLSRLVVARADPGLEPHLHTAGYVPTPKGWTLYAPRK